MSKVQQASWTRYRACLTDVELQRAARFHFEKDRRTYIAAHALIRTTLSRFARISPAAWQFTENSYGKPEIDQPTCGRKLRFNLSHTDGLVACAVSPTRRVGIDVEALDRRGVDLGIAESFFAPQEVRYLKALAPTLRQDAFFDFWTLKESFIKALGDGLSMGLDSFAFDLDSGRLVFVSEGDPNRWHFKRIRPTARHRLAVAAEGERDEHIRFVCAEVSPRSLMPVDEPSEPLGPGGVSGKGAQVS